LEIAETIATEHRNRSNWQQTIRAARYSQLVQPLWSVATVSMVSLTIQNFCSRAKHQYNQYGQYGGLYGHLTVETFGKHAV